MASIPESLVADLDIDGIVQSPVQAGPVITPEVSLDLRLRWLETLLFGARQGTQERPRSTQANDTRGNTTLKRGVEDLQRRLDMVVQNSEGLRRFMDYCMSRELSTILWIKSLSSR
jgi:hypothetical protein